MKENINLGVILKDVPKGTLLYSPLIGEVEFDKIDDFAQFPIHVRDKKGKKYEFTQQGTFFLGMGECVLFPSKDQKDWSKYQRLFKDGDILSNGRCICIFNGKEEDDYYGFYGGLGNIDLRDYFIDTPRNSYFTKEDTHLATEEEKQKLFQAIKDNGYKWNAETKTLEKLITPKFKVGDKIRHKTTNKDDIYEISKVYDDSYGLVNFTWMIYMKYQDSYELVPNKFDTSTLKCFDKVLVRNGEQDKWQAGLFSYLEEKKIGIDYGSYTKYFKSIITYNVNSDFYYYCIPYNDDTKHLVGTTKEAPEFYQIEYETNLID